MSLPVRLQHFALEQVPSFSSYLPYLAYDEEEQVYLVSKDADPTTLSPPPRARRISGQQSEKFLRAHVASRDEFTDLYTGTPDRGHPTASPLPE